MTGSTLRPPATGEVHVWLAHPGPSLAWAAVSCTDGERARAARLPLAQQRFQRLVTRGAVRHLLGAYTGTAPHLVDLVAARSGKPRIVGGDGPFFSVAHSADLAVVAVAARPVGVDVQHRDPHLDVEAVVRQCFSMAEVSALPAQAGTARRRAFFRTWCRKEAYLKATGTGWDVRLCDIAELVLMTGSADERYEARGTCLPWEVVDVPAPPGHDCAVAARGRGWTVLPPRLFELEPPARARHSSPPALLHPASTDAGLVLD